MATKNIEIQDSTGNIYYPHTDAAIVKFGNSNVDSTLSDMVYQTAGGSATAITITIKGPLATGYPITFIASANNGGAATTINGKKLYKPGTTTSPNLIAGKAYTVWYNSISDCFFIKASAEGTALAPDVRMNKTFSNDNDTGIVGGLDLSLLIPGNLRAGVTIDGVTGKSSVVDTADATVVANHMLAGETAYKNGAKVTGTVVNQGARTITPGAVDQTIASGVITTGAQTIKGDANLLATNIVAGISIFGVIGSVVSAGYVSGTTTTSVTGNNNKHEVNINVGFQPRAVIIHGFKVNTSTDYVSNLVVPSLGINIAASSGAYMTVVSITSTGFYAYDTYNRSGGDEVSYICFK
ncbi:hypothetical protein [Clostridium beijerinckii]|uniref:hypothetical protein n=1 Tax=Clostridium beijerinckii TaxID=1520 RepID=UPI00098C59DF|nr:hypothetical protein [Clostridium beijerinckii]NRT80325.1 hypothetical protein [Clostridium beijerinckii]OOM45160.1 hypothetical protein CBEIJ_34060 [Clostridium beijerinckii]